MIGMGGAIVLLLLGTQILDWYWVVMLVAASLGTGLYRARKKIPSTYTIAQWIDRRLNLADTLSTASYFSGNGVRGDDGVRRMQREQAETAARSVDVRQGIPFVRPRYLYPALILAAVAFGMFVLRYAVTGSLSLRPSLARIAFDTFFPAKPEQAKNRKPDPSKVDPGSPDSPQSEQEREAMLEAMDSATPANPQANEQAQETKKGDRSTESNEGKKADGSQEDQSKEGDQQAGNQDSKQGANSENSNLMDKLRDVMSNMMNKMTSSGQKSAQQNKSNGNSDKSNSDGKNSQNSDQKADGNSQSAQEQAQNQADASSSDQGTDKTASPDGKSGIGASDGEKRAREAEQLQAMGKISEILGKRSTDVSGEVMVEVGSSKQQLKTPWAQSQATHAEAGGEIHRDEVPLIYQQFVQQYFEQIRKSGAKPAAQ